MFTLLCKVRTFTNKTTFKLNKIELIEIAKDIKICTVIFISIKIGSFNFLVWQFSIQDY